MDLPFLPNHTVAPETNNVSGIVSDYYNYYMDSNFTGGNEEYEDPFSRIEVRVLFILLYGMVFTCSFFGKCLRLAAVMGTR
jgi:hypothetical protein